MIARAAIDPTAGQLLAWALVGLFALMAVVLAAGRRRPRGALGRLSRLIARPQAQADPEHRDGGVEADSAPIDLSPPVGLPTPSYGAGLPAAARPADTHGYLTQGETERPESSGGVDEPAVAPASRVVPETLVPLAGCVDRSRRLVLCEDRVAQTLLALSRDRWTVDRYVLLDGHRIPFVLLGETGVFGIWPLDGAHAPGDPAYFEQVAQAIHTLLPGYPGPVRAGICRPMDPELRPRWWYTPPAKAGGWVMGTSWLIPWLEHFGTEHGLSAGDVAHFDEQAGPHWQRRAVGAPIPNRPHTG